MARKRRYKTTPVKHVRLEALCEDVRQQRIVVGVDVAKEAMVAAVVDEGHAVLCTVRWSHPTETGVLLDLLEALREHAADVRVAMESSGTYGDALRWQCLTRAFDVHRVSAKHTHDMAEVYDGVPSKHDAKDAAIVGMLCLDGRSRPWPVTSAQQRELAAAVRLLDLYDGQLRQGISRLEAIIARHWPELTGYLDLQTATLLELLAAYGGPAAVAADPDGAHALMRRAGGPLLSEEKVWAVIASAEATAGLPQVAEELHLLSVLASDTRRAQKSLREAKRRIQSLAGAEASTRAMQAVVGVTTAGVLVATAGTPTAFDSPRSYVKALGLNLRERSSGRTKGQVRITKRGSSTARRWLYMATLRMLKANRVVRAWYAAKVVRDGGRTKRRAVVAVMRKLALALWHVARGAPFDATKLFDTRRLELAS